MTDQRPPHTVCRVGITVLPPVTFSLAPSQPRGCLDLGRGARSSPSPQTPALPVLLGVQPCVSHSPTWWVRSSRPWASTPPAWAQPDVPCNKTRHKLARPSFGARGVPEPLRTDGENSALALAGSPEAVSDGLVAGMGMVQAPSCTCGSVAAEGQAPLVCASGMATVPRTRGAPVPLNVRGGSKLLLEILKYAARSQGCQAATLWVLSWWR